MKLQRKWARVCLALMAAAALSACVPAAAYEWFGAKSLLWGILGAAGAVGFFLASLLVRRRRLRCPHCGKGSVSPRWMISHRLYCPYCGQPFLFDSDPDDSGLF